MAKYYTLRLFEIVKQVGISNVAMVSGAQSFPTVGQAIDDKWKVTEFLRSSESELEVRVERLQEANDQ